MSGAAAFEVHVLGPADVGLLRRMNAMMGEVFDMPDDYTGRAPDDAYLQALLAGDAFVGIVALKSGEVVGGLAAYVLPKFEQARSEVHVYDLAVLAAHRRQGIATALLAAVKPIARERGAHVIFIQADHGDDPAITLYTKLGRREDVLHFDIDPGDGAS